MQTVTLLSALKGNPAVQRSLKFEIGSERVRSFKNCFQMLNYKSGLWDAGAQLNECIIMATTAKRNIHCIRYL